MSILDSIAAFFNPQPTQPRTPNANVPYNVARGATVSASLGSRTKPAARLTARQLATPGMVGIQLQGPTGVDPSTGSVPVWAQGDLWNVWSRQQSAPVSTGAPRTFAEALSRLTASVGTALGGNAAPAFSTSIPGPSGVTFAQQPTAAPAQYVSVAPQAPVVQQIAPTPAPTIGGDVSQSVGGSGNGFLYTGSTFLQ